MNFSIVRITSAGYHLNRDWTNHRSLNNFESLAADFADGETSIRGLIIDEAFLHWAIEDIFLALANGTLH
jgi:hypothetical protein